MRRHSPPSGRTAAFSRLVRRRLSCRQCGSAAEWRAAAVLRHAAAARQAGRRAYVRRAAVRSSCCGRDGGERRAAAAAAATTAPPRPSLPPATLPPSRLSQSEHRRRTLLAASMRRSAPPCCTAARPLACRNARRSAAQPGILAAPALRQEERSAPRCSAEQTRRHMQPQRSNAAALTERAWVQWLGDGRPRVLSGAVLLWAEANGSAQASMCCWEAVQQRASRMGSASMAAG
jgi:hypothetical protein